MSTAEDCGILHGCENGRCIRVSEGYTCDCYQGYELDMTSMACVGESPPTRVCVRVLTEAVNPESVLADMDECEDGVDAPCVNARCVNTEGSFRCICRRGFVMTEPNRCVAA